MATNSEIELIKQCGTKCIQAKMVLADSFGLEKINTAEITIKVSEGDGLKLFRAVAGKNSLENNQTHFGGFLLPEIP